MPVDDTLAHEIFAYFNNSDDLLGSLDFNLNIMQINPAWEKTGFTTDAFMGANILNFVFTDDQLIAQVEFEDCLTELRPRRFRCSLQYQDESFYLYDWYLTPDEANQRLYLWLHEAIDLTDEETEYARQLRHILDQRYRELHILNMISAKISSSLQLDKILPEIAELTCFAMNMTSAYVCNVNFEANTTTILSEHISTEASPEEKISSGQITFSLNEELPRFKAWLEEPTRPLIQYLDDNELRMYDREYMLGYGLKSMIIVPLLVDGKVWGYLELWESRHLRRFSEQDVQLLQTIASRVAAAVANAKIYEIMETSEARYRKIVDSARDFIFQTDAHGNFTFANPATLNAMGYEAHEFIGRSYFDLIPEEYLDEITEFYKKQFDQLIPETYKEFPFKTKDGKLIWFGNIVQIVAEGRYVHGFYTIARDISQRKKVEAERELLIADLEAFAHTVAHDLKGPLNSIIGYTSLLATADYIEPQDAALLEAIERISYRMSHITDELLRMAEVRNLAAIPKQELDMVEMLRNVHDRLGYMFQQAQAELIVADSFHAALGYAPWIEEVLANYISNAIKYGGEPPLIEIGSTMLSDNRVQFWVRDNGRGLSEDELTHLFSQYTRLDKLRVSGHGLGLSIVKRIVEKLGGQVDVQSTLNEGSTFSFILPAVPTNS